MSLPRRAPTGALLLLLGLDLLGPPPARASRSSFSPAGHGSKVFYLLLEDLGYKVNRAFDLREVDPSTQLLVAIGPPESPQQGARLLAWVSAGKLLLLAPPLEGEGTYCQSYKLGSMRITRRLSLTGSSGGQASGPAGLKLRPSACVLRAPPSATVVAGRPDRALAFEHSADRGRILVLAHEDLLVNENLDRDDLVVLVRRWLNAQLPGASRVTFLEQKQGGQLLDLLKRSNLTLFAVHGLLWLLLLYWALAPRFGDPFPPPASTRRAFAEHARALGALYRHRGASGHMLRQQFERFLARLTGRGERRVLGGMRPPEIRPGRQALANMVATRTGRDADSVEALLAQLDRAMQESAGRDPRQIQRHFRLSQSLAALQRVSAARSQSASGGSRARTGRPRIR